MPTLLYLPEIGDRITLAEDWTFSLHQEHRNAALWEILSGDADPVIIERLRRTEALNAEILAIQARGRVENADATPGKVSPHWQAASRQEYVHRNEALENELLDLINAEASIQVTLPAGTELTVDRVHIRKSVSDYSSLSFTLGATPDPRISAARGRKRFRAKLADCGRIVMETPEPAEAPDGPGL